ncbi:4-hydroxy-4-methyl-2-oxoglutarate aldolase/4-carboxy-4-hydroxy-2-oxoadipate aldolase [Castellaniella defragrans]
MQNAIIYNQIPEASRRVVVPEALNVCVADLHEAMSPVSRHGALMNTGMRGLNRGLRAIGRAVTALCDPGDNLMVQPALRLAQLGDVVVMTNGGIAHGAMFGEMMATYVMEKKIAAVVVCGPIRDVDVLREMRVPVWSTCISPDHPERRGPGAVNVPVNCAGVRVNPGDVIVADGDGVIAIPYLDFESVLLRAEERVAKEANIIAALKKGEHLIDLSGASGVLETLGVVTQNSDWLSNTSSA